MANVLPTDKQIAIINGLSEGSSIRAVESINPSHLRIQQEAENFEAAVALHFAYYNFVKRHNALRCAPAMAIGIERDFWSVGQLVEVAA